MDRLPFLDALSATATPSPRKTGAAVREASPRSRNLGKIYDTLFKTSPEAILATDEQGRILELNAQAEKRFASTREELIGESIEKLVPERLREGHRQRRRDYLAAPNFREKNFRTQMYVVRKDGSEFPIDVSVTPVETDEGTVFCIIVRDSSEPVAAQQMQVRLKFEEKLTGLSARFINLKANRVDEEINGALQILAEALNTDRATIGQIDQPSGDILVTHAWARPGFPAFGERVLKGLMPWLEERIKAGETSVAGTPEDLPAEAIHEREYMYAVGEMSSVVVPFRVGGIVIGGLHTSSFREHIHWNEELVSRIQDVADIFANALSRKKSDEELQKALAQVQELKEKIEQENVHLREEITLAYSHREVVGNSQAMRGALKKAEQVAGTDSAVLILGETGTGKDLIARTIHEMSRRKDKSMVRINCAALPATLIESELFGREKGAYTGSLAREIGRFELADKATIFLDEIGELPLELQSKLLRVLQEGEFERLGSSKTIKVDVRVIAATNRNLQALVNDGKFRQDLFYRLNVFPILIPPLRERREDIPALVWHILKDLGKPMGRNVEGVHAATMRDFQKYSWPGNVREMRNVIERSLIMNSGSIFRGELPDSESSGGGSLRRLDEVESEHFQEVLQMTRWRVRGRGGAAEILGLKPTTLEARMKKLGIRRP
jgi:formate hydrogenlyase transcriptional activator